MDPFPRKYEFYTDNEDIKEEFELMFMNWYWGQDIEQETWNGYLRRFKAIMRKIMPRYKQMYEISKIELEIENVNIKELIRQDKKVNVMNESQSSSDSSTTGDTSSESENLVLDNDTPQGQVDINRIKDYVSGVTDSVGKDKGTSKTTSKGVSKATSKADTKDEMDTVRELKGYQGNKTVAELKYEFMNYCRDLNEMLIEELDVLFMEVL